MSPEESPRDLALHFDKSPGPGMPSIGRHSSDDSEKQHDLTVTFETKGSNKKGKRKKKTDTTASITTTDTGHTTDAPMDTPQNNEPSGLTKWLAGKLLGILLRKGESGSADTRSLSERERGNPSTQNSGGIDKGNCSLSGLPCTTAVEDGRK